MMLQTGLAALSVLATTACSVFGVESVEEASHRVVEQDGQFEVRVYEPMIVVETRVDSDFKAAGNSAFRKLFAYISGENTGGEEIAMTAPVVAEKKVQNQGAKIAMTAPVIARQEAGAWLYRFVLPEGYTLQTAPRPLDPAVSLAEIPQQRVAAIRFSGRLTDNARASNSDALKLWIDAKGLRSTSQPRWAGYNAPWALPPFRRNEVLIDVTDNE